MTTPETTTPDAVHRPALAARCAVITATLVLPRGLSRARYRQEFLAELHYIDTPTQLRFSAGIMSRAWALRRALTKEGAMLRHTVPLRCLLRLHSVEQVYTEDGVPWFRRCRRCDWQKIPGGPAAVDHPTWTTKRGWRGERP
jgi:hypothetical protein